MPEDDFGQTRDIRFLEPAAQEYEEALVWYQSRNEQAADQFERAVEGALERISDAPLRWPLVDGQHRLCLVNKPFPYHLVYRVDDTEVVVVAVAHGRRKPDYWRGRDSAT